MSQPYSSAGRDKDPKGLKFQEITRFKESIEAVVGEGKDYNYVQFFTVSTGLGAGFVINKEIYHGAHGFGNEVANCVMMKDGPSHGSIIPGGIEAISSGTAITSRAVKAGLDVKHAIE